MRPISQPVISKIDGVIITSIAYRDGIIIEYAVPHGTDMPPARGPTLGGRLLGSFDEDDVSYITIWTPTLYEQKTALNCIVGSCPIMWD